MDRNELITLLSNNICNISFRKADDSIREMRCTLKNEYITTTKNESSKPRKVNEEVLPVWDMNNNGWRSFRIDSIIDIQLELV